MKSIIFFGIDKEDMVKVREKMEKRFKYVRWYSVQVTVIISFPSQHHKLDANCAVRMTHLWTSMTSEFQLELLLATMHHRLTSLASIICCGGLVWWTKLFGEQGDVDVQFVHPHGPRKTFNWPQGSNSCYVPMKNIVCAIQAPYYIHWKNLQNLWWRLWQNGCCICKTSFVNSCWFGAVKTCYDVPYK